MAVSVLPVPLVPTSRKTPIGPAGIGQPGPRGANALGNDLQGVVLAHDPLLHRLLEREDRADLVLHHAADGNARPARDHLGHRLAIDADLHQRVFALDLFQLGFQAMELTAEGIELFRGERRRGAGALTPGPSPGGGSRGANGLHPRPLSRRERGGCRQTASSCSRIAPDLGHQPRFLFPAGFQFFQLGLGGRFGRLALGKPLGMVGPGRDLAAGEYRFPGSHAGSASGTPPRRAVRSIARSPPGR